MKILGLIPARGGSKGIPGKNIKELAGKPLIAYTIEQAHTAKLLERVILSTDDPAIADVAKYFGLEVPFMRPAELATDSAGSLGVVLHALQTMKATGNVYDAVCLLQPTSPWRPMGSIDEAVQLFLEKRPDSLVSVRRVPDEYNPHWVFEMDLRHKLYLSTGEEKIIPRRQDLPATWHRDGAIYISSVETIKSKHSLYGETILGFPIESPELINLDTMEDWKTAERVFADR